VSYNTFQRIAFDNRMNPKQILAGLPESLRDPLMASYREIVANYLEHRWGASELDGGKFCEIVYSILKGAVSGTFPAKPSKPPRMVDACRELESQPADTKRVGDRSLRVLIPRVLPVLYEIRNQRGVGHIGGDVDPNFLDATAVLGMTSWVLAELVRVFHDVSTTEAQQTVDALIERKQPLIWEVGTVKRVLDPSMPAANQTLIFLHQRLGWVAEKDLVSWIEYSNPSVFRSKVILPMHKKRFLEYDEINARVHISPLGIKHVEEKILKSRAN
jgi:hypothetical protein